MENKSCSKRRRKLAIEATDQEQAKKLFYDKCNPIGFAPDITTLREINPKEYHNIIRILTGNTK